MAKDTTKTVEIGSNPAPFGYKADGTPRKRAVKEGPRVNKPIHVLFQVTGSDGQPIEGATLNVLYAGKEPEKLVEAMEKNPGAQRTKVQL